jgi:Flp pilus assembly pilin Flp
MRQLAGLLAEQDGLETVEYAVVGGVLFTGAIAIIAAVALWVESRFEGLQSTLGA